MLRCAHDRTFARSPVIVRKYQSADRADFSDKQQQLVDFIEILQIARKCVNFGFWGLEKKILLCSTAGATARSARSQEKAAQPEDKLFALEKSERAGRLKGPL